MKKISIILSVFLMMFSSCMFINYSRIEVRNDEIKKIRTVHLRGNHFKTIERRSPLESNSKHFYKATNQNGVTNYYVYEILKFNLTSLPINDTIYLITDTEILPIKTQKLEIFAKMERTPIKEDIEESDSTTTSVITGYNEEYKQIQKIKYQLHDKEIEAIKNTESLKFRYYSEPEMITIKINRISLNKIQRFIYK